MKHWYKVEVYRAHRGAGRRESVIVYIYAENVIGVINRYKIMPGVKRSLTPNIFPLSLNESLGLESRIINERIVSLNKARRTWYYSENP